MKRSFILFIVVFLFIHATLEAQSYTQVASGAYHSLGLQQDGTLWAWGQNSSYQLGDGTTTDRNSPIKIGQDTDWASIYATKDRSYAIKTDGSLWGWGGNALGQLGTGNSLLATKPTQIGTDKNWATLSASSFHVLAVKTDGTLWTWGINVRGQLGDGTTYPQNAPAQIGTDTNWKSVSAGLYHSLAVKTDGTLWAWGDNYFGQLGDNTNTERHAPIQITTRTVWESVKAGRFFSIALTKNGAINVWGDNREGKLGLGDMLNRDEPRPLSGDSDWEFISTQENHITAIKVDGTLWGWGINSDGRIGDGTQSNKLAPTMLDGSPNWSQAASGGTHNVFLKQDGSICVSGLNTYGQLGQGASLITNNGLICSAASLPVEWAYFEANAAGPVNLLEWGTLEEINNDHFVVQRSVDGQSFEAIGNVLAEGEGASYEFQDPAPKMSRVYYRLKQVDVDGQFSFSRTIEINRTTAREEVRMTCFPTRNDGNFSLRAIGFNQEEPVVVSVLNAAGKEVFQKVSSTTALLDLSVHMGKVPAGLYLVKIQRADQTGRLPLQLSERILITP